MVIETIARSALIVAALSIPCAAQAADPFGVQTLISVDTPSKLVVGELNNSIVGHLAPCMVMGEYCPAIWVGLYDGSKAIGTLVKTGPSHWREYAYAPHTRVGTARFNFRETGRSGNVIQLDDSSRGVQLEIDLDDGVVRYGEDGGPKRVLYKASALKKGR
ncbi:hypothetical protein [Halochromatium roseum]|uniref:hypothetical protein n=1 Tax=Halochromatium roseum TaxID=391920 RepID=UPI00191338C9|nr:hypothetical protein [Halochromatium roseum]MBK5938565.1 hypothetical protein [Halochromatium roseum]